jgi:excisionase family DNA binding protein
MATRVDKRLARIERLAAERDLSTDEVLAVLEDALASVEAAHAQRGRELSAAEERVLAAEGLGRPRGNREAVKRSLGHYTHTLQEALTTKQAAHRLGVTESRVRQLLGERRLYGIKAHRGGWRLPLWQFSGGQVVPGLERVLERLSPGLHPLGVEGFLTTPKPELVLGDQNVSPLEWLTAGGDPEPIVELAGEV